MLRLITTLVTALFSGLRSRRDLVFENLALRQQLATILQIRDLVRRMAAENGWRATRIHGELLKLGFQVSERTGSRYLRKRDPRPEQRQSWLTFLRNHRELTRVGGLYHCYFWQLAQ